MKKNTYNIFRKKTPKPLAIAIALIVAPVTANLLSSSAFAGTTTTTTTPTTTSTTTSSNNLSTFANQNLQNLGNILQQTQQAAQQQAQQQLLQVQGQPITISTSVVAPDKTAQEWASYINDAVYSNNIEPRTMDQWLILLNKFGKTTQTTEQWVSSLNKMQADSSSLMSWTGSFIKYLTADLCQVGNYDKNSVNLQQQQQCQVEAYFKTNCQTPSGFDGLTQIDGSCLAIHFDKSSIIQTDVIARGEVKASGGIANSAPSSAPTYIPRLGDYDFASSVDPSFYTVKPELKQVFKDIEADAVATVLSAHLLPVTDADLVLDSARDEVRAAIYNNLLTIAQKDSWTASEQLIMDYYAKKLQRRNLKAAEFAQYQYNLWNTNICFLGGKGWAPPVGYTYDWNTLSVDQCNPHNRNIGLLAGAGHAGPPSVEEFASYGTAFGFGDLVNSEFTLSSANTISSAAFMGAVLGGGAAGSVVAGGTAGGLVYKYGTAVKTTDNATQAVKVIKPIGYRMMRAIAPHLINEMAALVVGGTEAAINGTRAAVAAASITVKVIGAVEAAGSFIGAANPLLIMIDAIVNCVFQGIQVVGESKIPEKLQNKVNEAKAMPDLHKTVQTDSGLATFYALFVHSTLPEMPSTRTPPAPSSNDSQFRIFDAKGQLLGTKSSLSLKLNTKGFTEQVRLNKGWVIQSVTDAQGKQSSQYATSFNYVDWSGVSKKAWRRGDKLIITSSKDNDPSEGSETVVFDYQDPQGVKYIASLLPDATPPNISYQVTGKSGINPNWSTTPLSVAWTIIDNESPIYKKSGCDPVALSTSGKYSLTCTATSSGGQNAVTSNFSVDTVQPTIASTQATGSGTWLHSPVTFQCSDDLSGVADCPKPITIKEGLNQSLPAVRVTDIAGNYASLTLTGINADNTAPTIRVLPMPMILSTNGWFNKDVTVNFSCNDVPSGIASCLPQVVSKEAANQSIVGTAVDKAGNTATATKSISLDKTPPTCTATATKGSSSSVPPKSTSAILVSINVDVNVRDTLSGGNGFVLTSISSNQTDSPSDIVGWSVGTASTTGQLNSKFSDPKAFRSRIYTLTYKGMDKAGNSGTCSTTVSF